MGTLKKLGLVALVIAAAFGAGRYSAPGKIEERIKTEVRKEIVTVVKEITRPDGTIERETTISDRVDTVKERDKTVENNKTQYKVSGLIGRNMDNNKDVYGAIVEKRLFANSMVGIWGTTEKQLGLSLSVEF